MKKIYFLILFVNTASGVGDQDGPEKPTFAPKVCDNAGNFTLDSFTGSVESEHPYRANEFCYYDITPPGQVRAIKFKFLKFDVEDEEATDNYNKAEDNIHHSHECEWDYVQISWKK